MNENLRSEALYFIRDDFLSSADQEERRFVESSEEPVEIILFKDVFFRELLAVRFRLFDTLNGSVLFGDMEEFLYPNRERAQKLLTKVRREFPSLDLQTLAGEFDSTMRMVDSQCHDIVLAEHTIPYTITDLDERYTRFALTPNDFTMFDEDLDAVDAESEKEDQPLPDECTRSIIEALKDEEFVETGKIALRGCDGRKGYLHANIYDDLDDPTVEFSVQDRSVLQRTNSVQYRNFIVLNSQTTQWCSVVNNLSDDIRGKLARHLIQTETEKDIREKLNRKISLSVLMDLYQMSKEGILTKALNYSWPELLKRIRNGALQMNSLDEMDWS